MHIGLTPEQEELRSDLRAYYDELLTPEIIAEVQKSEGIGPVCREVVRRMGADGWLGIGWPTEYGGQARGHVDQFIFYDESMRSGAPVPMLTINTVGPTLMDYGTQEQRDFYLPKILAGEIHFCIGYTEPEAGTDLAALRTRAVRIAEGDERCLGLTQAPMAGRTIAALRFTDHSSSERPSHLRRSVLRPIVDHQGTHVSGQRSEDTRQRARLVEARQDHLYAGVVRTQCARRSMAISSAILSAKSSRARHPSSRAARSAEAVIWRTSPSRPLPVTTGVGEPAAAASLIAISPTVRGVPLAMLYARDWPSGTGASRAAMQARATSRTWTKSRRWPPSSVTCGARPASTALRKIDATPE